MNPTGLLRNTIDKYYTKPEIAALCLEHVKRVLNPSYTNDCIIEPSAGNGVFIPGIQQLVQRSRFYDLHPENPDIVQQDYLLLAPEEGSPPGGEGGRVHVIGNPPFGRQSSMAIKFIKKSAEFCDTISFILPKSFRKDSMKRAFPRIFHLLFECDIPQNSFLVDGQEHDVPCIFQIWERLAHERALTEKCVPAGFEFVAKTDQPDISFRRVGMNAGAIDVACSEKSEQSHYFIRFDDRADLEIILNAVFEYDFNNTVGPRSISKQELIAKFNAVLETH
jgi:predicted RNA methylase